MRNNIRINDVDDDDDVVPGEDKPRVMAPTLVCLDCLVATMAATVGGGRDARLLERMRLESGSLVWKTSWEEEEVTAAVTVDTTQDTTQDTTNTLRIPTAIPAAAFSSRGSVSVTTR